MSPKVNVSATRFQYYAVSASADPTGFARGPDRGIRGGSWSMLPHGGRPADRNSYAPDIGNSSIGFRVAVCAVRR